MLSPLVYGLFAVLLWTVHATVAALTVRQISSMEFTLLTYVVGWVILRSRMPVLSTSRRMGWKSTLYLVLSGPLLLGYYFAFYAGLSMAPAIEVYAIHLLWPVFMALFCDWFAADKAPMSGREWALLWLAFAGAAIVAIGPGELAAARQYASGYALALLSALCGGLYFPALLNASTGLKRHGMKELDSFALPFFILVSAGMIPMGVVYLMYSNSAVLDINPGAVAAVLYTGLGVVVAAELFWLLGMRGHHKSTVTSLAYLTPLFSALLLWMFAGAALSLAAAAGIGIIVLANMLLHHKPMRAARAGGRAG